MDESSLEEMSRKILGKNWAAGIFGVGGILEEVGGISARGILEDRKSGISEIWDFGKNREFEENRDLGKSFGKVFYDERKVQNK